MFVVKYRKIWFTLSTLLLLVSFWAIFTYGFNLSIDFKGGTLTEVKYTQVRPVQSELEAKISALNLGGFSIRPSGETGYIIRTRELNQAENQTFKTSLAVEQPGVSVIERQNTIGPAAGAELQGKATKAILVVVFMIVLFVTFAFRKVSKPVASWKYGLATIIALAHDVEFPQGCIL